MVPVALFQDCVVDFWNLMLLLKLLLDDQVLRRVMPWELLSSMVVRHHTVSRMLVLIWLAVPLE